MNSGHPAGSRIADHVQELRNDGLPGGYLFPRLSRDGSRLLLRVNEEASTDLWIYDLRRGGRQRLIGGTDVHSSPVWSPDGRFVVLQSLRGIFWLRADGA